jgi:hypothetical protein
MQNQFKKQILFYSTSCQDSFMNTQDKTNPLMVVELVDSVVKPLLVVSEALSEVKKGLSKTQKAFEGLAYQSATVRGATRI